jgi:hypothetical protein
MLSKEFKKAPHGNIWLNTHPPPQNTLMKESKGRKGGKKALMLTPSSGGVCAKLAFSRFLHLSYTTIPVVSLKSI